MNSTVFDVDFECLRSLYGRSAAAQAILDHFAGRERNQRTTKVDRVLEILQSSEEEISRGDVIDVFKAFEECGCGHFKAGRRGKKSRFEWTARMITVGQAAAGETDRIEALTAEDVDDEDEGSETSLDHAYRLRPDFNVPLQLPKDLTTTEAERLARFILTLPFQQDWHNDSAHLQRMATLDGCPYPVEQLQRMRAEQGGRQLPEIWRSLEAK